MDTDVCIAGGGPAGMVLGLLLARRGVAVTVLEKHADFLRDFRGDTVHPSTLDVMDEVGLGARMREVPHRDVDRLQFTFADGSYRVADFSRLPVAHPYVRFMPQWDFLDVLADAAGELPGFRLLRRHEVTGVLREDGVVRGVTARGPDGAVRLTATLTVGADGRGSVVRADAGLPLRELGAPMDVLWFRLTRRPGSARGLGGHVGPGRLVLLIDRGESWQVAYVIPKGSGDAVRAAGIDAFRAAVVGVVPDLADVVEELRGWDDVRMLTVRLDRLRRWWAPGLLCIGDAAHAMSPVGGVGINLAVQDAVAAARILAGPLLAGTISPRDLAAVQTRRRWPTVGTQLGQQVAQRFLVQRALHSDAPVRAPAPVRLLQRVPALQVVPARLVGIGLRPEHVATPPPPR